MHVSLDTADLGAAVEFYTRLTGRPPARHRADWAKFELDVPPLVLSLNAIQAPLPRGRLAHLGIRLPDRSALEAARSRLTAAGLALREEPEVTCCYARQDKIWVEDPDGNAWEFYLLRGEVDAPSAAASDASCCVPSR